MSITHLQSEDLKPDEKSQTGMTLARCIVCNNLISALPGTRNATCKVCGYKDPCCE